MGAWRLDWIATVLLPLNKERIREIYGHCFAHLVPWLAWIRGDGTFVAHDRHRPSKYPRSIVGSALPIEVLTWQDR